MGEGRREGSERGKRVWARRKLGEGTLSDEALALAQARVLDRWAFKGRGGCGF